MGPKMLGWIKHWRYHLKPIANEYLHHEVYRMANARQIICCKGPARQPPIMTHRPNIIQMTWGKYWKYHLKLIGSYLACPAEFRNTHARQIVCCIGPGRHPRWAPKIGLDQTLEVPHETNGKWMLTPHNVQNGPCQTNWLLQRARQTAPKHDSQAQNSKNHLG